MRTSRLLWLVLGPLAALGAGLLAGGLVGWVVAQLLLLTADPQATFADLGAIVVGMVVGVVVGVTVWLVGLARASRRLFAPGGRLAPVLWSAVAVLVLWVAMAAVSGSGSGSPVVAGSVLLGLLVVAAPSVVFVLSDRRTATATAPAEAAAPVAPPGPSLP